MKWNYLSRQVNLLDEVRRTGTQVMAPTGWGKSRLLGRGLIYGDIMRGIPTLVIDIPGVTISNVLDKLSDYDNVVYYDMSENWGFTPCFPLYDRGLKDTLRTVASRFIDVAVKADPELARAPTTGKNAMERVGIPAGAVLAALGLQIDSMPSLLNDPKGWRTQLESLLGTEADWAAKFFLKEYDEIEQSQKNTLLGKIQPFISDERLRAMFCGAEPSIKWDKFIKNKQTILLEFGNDPNRQFKILWVLKSFFDFIESRGPTRKSPVSLVIDELAAMVRPEMYNNLLGEYLYDMITRVARNHNVWLTVAHQELFALPEQMQKGLMSMGTQIIGGVTDHPTRIALTTHFYDYDAYMIKERQNVWLTVEDEGFSLFGSRRSRPQIIDHRNVYFTADDQIRMDSGRWKRLKKFEFWCATSPEEGTRSFELNLVTIHKLDEGIYPTEHHIAWVKEGLNAQCGNPIDELIEVIEERYQRVLGMKALGEAPPKPRSQKKLRG